MRAAPSCPATFPRQPCPPPIHLLSPSAPPSPNPPSSLAGAALPRSIYFPFPRHRRTFPRLNLQRCRRLVVGNAVLPLSLDFRGAKTQRDLRGAWHNHCLPAATCPPSSPCLPAVIHFLSGSPPLDAGQGEELSRSGGHQGFASSGSGGHGLRRLICCFPWL
ncbi:hypothetical protein VPH35_027812 [Triticum aestivum]